jgi:PAS domain S-box-containing protein
MDITHPEDQGCDMPLIERALETGEPFVIEKRFIRSDGKVAWVRNTISQLDDSKQLQSVCVDISEQKRAEEELQRHQRELLDFFEHATLGLHLVGPDGTILRANQAELDMLGYSREEYVGRNIAEFHADAPVLDEILHCLSQGKVLKEHPARLRCKDGSIRHVVIDSSALFEDGEFIHTRCFTRDVTERVRSEESLLERERSFREMIDALPAAIYTTDADGRLTHFNPAAVEFSGRTPELGTDQWCVTMKLYQPDGQPLAHEDCPMAVALKEQRSVFGCEAIAERPDGSRVWFAPYPTPLFDEEGRLTGGINMLVDITERKEANEAQIKRSRENAALFQLSEALQKARDLGDVYESAVDSVLSALCVDRASILLFDSDKVMRFVASRKLSETYRNAVEGHSPWTYGESNPQPICIDDVRSSDLPQGLKDVVETEGIRSLAFIPLVANDDLIGKFMVYYDKPHSFAPDEIQLAMTIGGQLAQGILGKQAEEELRASEARLRELSEQLEDLVSERTAELIQINEQLQGFTYSVAHDLRQEIRGISSNASLLLLDAGESLDEENRATLGRLANNAKKLAALIDALLAYARLGKQEPNMLPFDMTSLSEEVAAYVIEHGSCKPGTRFRVSPGMTARGDEAMIRIVLVNLLENACKYSRNTATPIIEVGQEGDSFFVRDNGIGFSMKYVHKLFQPFERLHRDCEYSGTGIGLANVKRIIEKHGGAVWAKGEVGEGATFHFKL